MDKRVSSRRSFFKRSAELLSAVTLPTVGVLSTKNTDTPPKTSRASYKISQPRKGYKMLEDTLHNLKNPAVRAAWEKGGCDVDATIVSLNLTQKAINNPNLPNKIRAKAASDKLFYDLRDMKIPFSELYAANICCNLKIEGINVSGPHNLTFWLGNVTVSRITLVVDPEHRVTGLKIYTKAQMRKIIMALDRKYGYRK